jgi:hypothetical protein
MREVNFAGIDRKSGEILRDESSVKVAKRLTLQGSAGSVLPLQRFELLLTQVEKNPRNEGRSS